MVDNLRFGGYSIGPNRQCMPEQWLTLAALIYNWQLKPVIMPVHRRCHLC